MGRRDTHIKTLTRRADIHAYKAVEHVAAIGRLPRVISFRDGGQCTINRASVVNDDLVLNVKFEGGSRVLSFKWVIRNPTVLVDDPLGDVTNVEGETFREDPFARIEMLITRRYAEMLND